MTDGWESPDTLLLTHALSERGSRERASSRTAAHRPPDTSHALKTLMDRIVKRSVSRPHNALELGLWQHSTVIYRLVSCRVVSCRALPYSLVSSLVASPLHSFSHCQFHSLHTSVCLLVSILHCADHESVCCYYRYRNRDCAYALSHSLSLITLHLVTSLSLPSPFPSSLFSSSPLYTLRSRDASRAPRGDFR